MAITSQQTPGGLHPSFQQSQNQLLVIAPKLETPLASTLVRHHPLPVNIVPNLPKPRLLPRSRFGCWTCRNRKVKCDEIRPRCTPCARLGHFCDYNPRLSFKDDTPRVVEKMKHLESSGSLVWHTTSITPSVEGNHINDFKADSLPPFSVLTSDEDREKKAEYRAPGTYNIVVNPSSFTNMEEYRGSSNEPTPKLKLARANSLQRQQSMSSITGLGSSGDPQDDPDVVILAYFEADTMSMSVSNNHNTHSTISIASSPSISSSTSYTSHTDVATFLNEAMPAQNFVQIPYRNGEDDQLIAHFNKFVQRSFAQVHRDALGTTSDTHTLLAHDVFAGEAAHFPPLFHALMALTALSMDNRGGAQNVDALQHYQKAFPSLQSSVKTTEDLSSDLVLLTHFILLLYEIAASEPKKSNLWSQHLDQLLRIIKLRHDMFDPERYSFIIWWMFVIDAHGVLTGGGDGVHAKSLLINDLLPKTDRPVLEFAPNGSVFPPSTRMETGPSVLEFHREIYVQAARLGLLARELRKEVAQHGAHALTHRAVHSRMQRTIQARDLLEQIWNTHVPMFTALGYTNEHIPVKDRGIFEHTYALYRACIIYSHTTMWPTQRLEFGHPNHPRVAQYALEILHLGREIVDHDRLERKFIVFPLFMAGFVSNSVPDRDEAMELLTALEQQTMGRVANASRVLLRLVYERQELSRQNGGNALDVDWVQIVMESGLQVVNCRL